MLMVPVTGGSDDDFTPLDLGFQDGGVISFALEPQSIESASYLHEVEFEVKYSQPGLDDEVKSVKFHSTSTP